MSDDEITLDELSERTAVEPRTLRSWVKEGLLSPPFKVGRGARYPASNADRALAVLVLKDIYGLSLSEIGRRFMLATEDQIRAWALEGGPTLAPRGTARDYLTRVLARERGPLILRKKIDIDPQALPPDEVRLERSETWPSPDSPVAPDGDDLGADLVNIEWLILQLEQVFGTSAPRRAQGTTWTRIPITPDLELSVRGDLEPREQLLFEQLADQFRAILTRRTRNA